MPPSAHGAAGASCTSASRSTTTGSLPCCARTRVSRPSSPPTPTAPARPTRCSAARSPASRATDYALVGAIGHDFYTGEREGAKGFPRFTDPRLRGPEGYADYVRMATERSLERCGVDAFDLLLLHNPDRTGYTSEAVWDALRGRARRRA